MTRNARLAICTLVLTFLTVFPLGASAEWNEPHVEGAQEHPLLKYYPQARVIEYDQKEFDSAELVIGYTKGAENPAQIEAIEGRVTKYTYEHKPNTSGLEIVRQYEGALKKVGFVTIVAGKEIAGTPCNSDESFGAFRLDKNGKPAVYVNVNGGTGGGPTSRVTIIELKLMDQKLEADANAMFDEISKSGRVAVYGINFDTAKATIKPDSEKVLGEVQKLVAAHPELKLKIEGHTDNVGVAAANKKLSEDRANSVKTWLTAHGAKAVNLTTLGIGDTKPVGDNATEAGRAKNRRVELVKQ